MKRILKAIGKIVLVLLSFIILFTGFILVARKVNKTKLDEVALAYNSHPMVNELYNISPENIGVMKRKFIGEKMRAYHHIPNDIRYKGVVITFGGTEGSGNDNLAYYLASDGYEVISAYYFGQKDQPESVKGIPLEIYEEIYNYIQVNCKDPEIVTIIGASKGAQLALLLSTYYDTIDNLVLFSPSSHVTGPYISSQESSWTYRGEDIKPLNGKAGLMGVFKKLINVLSNTPDNQVKLRNKMFKKSTNLEEARIKVENSDANILIFYGDDDGAHDARLHSSIIKEHARKEPIIYEYKNVGHSFGSPPIAKSYPVGSYRYGGEIDANIKADLDSKKVLLEVLKEWHR